MTADVVDYFCSGFDCRAGGGGVEGVDGEDCFGFLFEDGFDGRGGCGLVLRLPKEVWRWGGWIRRLCRGCLRLRLAFFGLFCGAFGGVCRGVEETSVGEGVGRDIEDAHDKSSAAEWEGSGAKVPVVMAARHKGHEGDFSGFGREYSASRDCQL